MGRGIKGDKNSASTLSSKPSMIDRMWAQMQARMAAKAAAAGSSTMPESSGAHADPPHGREPLSPPVSSDHSATHSRHHSTPLAQSSHQVEGTVFPCDEELLPGRSPHLGNFFSPSRHYGESPADQSPHTPLQVLPRRLLRCRPSVVLTSNRSTSSLQHRTPRQSKGSGQVCFSTSNGTTSNNPELAVPSTPTPSKKSAKAKGKRRAQDEPDEEGDASGRKRKSKHCRVGK